MRRLIALIVFVIFVGGLVGALLDQIHVRGGALAYASPAWLGQSWWVAPQFGIAFALGTAAGLLAQHRRDPAGAEQVSVGRLCSSALWFVGVYLLTGLAWEQPWLLTGVLIALVAWRIWRRPPDRMTIAIAVVLAIAGTGWEAALSSVGDTFSYADPQIGPVPVWLALLYVHSAPLVRELLVAGARVVWWSHQEPHRPSELDR